MFDAVEAQILKGLDCLAQAGTGEARHEDDAQRTHMKLFSPERANALISKLEPLIEELLKRRRELAIKLLESDPALHHTPPRAARGSPRRARRCRRRASASSSTRSGGLIYRVESFGCVVKDIDLGLVDFPSMRDDEPIYLCWKLGESEVGLLARHRRGLQRAQTA